MIDEDMLVVDLEDGRRLSVPLAWFPRLAAANAAQRSRWELVGRGIGISWPEIDEDISIENLLQSEGELLIARDLGMGMEHLAINIVRHWSGSHDDLISQLCRVWFSNRNDAELWLLTHENREAKSDPHSEDTPTTEEPPSIHRPTH